jgi:hypothetical protein
MEIESDAESERWEDFFGEASLSMPFSFPLYVVVFGRSIDTTINFMAMGHVN